MHHLRDAFDTPKDYNDLTTTKIRDKLTHLFRDCRKPTSLGIADLWKRGMDALDPVKFNGAYPNVTIDAEDVSDDEDAPTQEVAGEDQGGSSPGPSMTAAPTIKRKRGSNAGEEAAEYFKSRKVNRSNSTSAFPIGASREEREAEIEADILRVADDDDEDVTSPKEDTTRARPKAKPKSQKSKAKTRVPSSSPEPQERSAVVIKPDQMEATMLKLQSAISIAVTTYLAALNFPPDAHPALDVHQPFTPELQLLFAELMGTNGHNWDETQILLQTLVSSQTYDQVSLNIFLQALLGTAVMVWVLDESLLENSHMTHALLGGIIAFAPEAKDEIHARAIVAYLQKQIIPIMPARARHLANLFDAQLGQVLPNRRPRSSLLSNPASDERVMKATAPVPKVQGYTHHASAESLVAGRPRSIIVTEGQKKWIEDLSEVFELALRVRAELDRASYKLEWSFEMPVFHEGYGAKEEGERVGLGLLPSVKQRNVVLGEESEEEGEGEEGRGWELLFEGRFHGVVFDLQGAGQVEGDGEVEGVVDAQATVTAETGGEADVDGDAAMDDGDR